MQALLHAGCRAAGGGVIRAEERRFGEWTVRIDRTICVGFGDCIEEAPDHFELDDEGVAIFRDTGRVDRGRLEAACRACPVDALVLLDADGSQIHPRRAG